MQEIILAVSPMGWSAGELIRAIGFSLTLLICAIVIIRGVIRQRREMREWLEIQEQRIIRARQEAKRNPWKNRRKDHPLTNIFKEQK